MSLKRTIKSLSIDDKRLTKEVESCSPKKDVAMKYGVPANAVSTISQNKQKVIIAIESGGASESSKRVRKNVRKCGQRNFRGLNQQGCRIYLYLEG